MSLGTAHRRARNGVESHTHPDLRAVPSEHDDDEGVDVGVDSPAESRDVPVAGVEDLDTPATDDVVRGDVPVDDGEDLEGPAAGWVASEGPGSDGGVEVAPESGAEPPAGVEVPRVFPERKVRSERSWFDGPGERRPVIHPAFQEPRAVAQDAWERFLHWAKFHGVRLVGCVYLVLVLGYAARGLVRLAPGAAVWASHRDGAERIRIAQDERDHQAAAFHERQHRFTVVMRLVFVLVGAAVLLASPLWLRAAIADPDRRTAGLAVFAGLVGGLAWFGRPLDGRPFLPKAATADGSPDKQITDVMIREALVDAGLSRNNDPESITFAEPPTRVRSGTKGWECVVVLPGNKTAVDAIKAQVKIAGGLDVDESRVFIERIRGSAGSARRIRLFVANEDPMSAPPIPTPLLEAGPVDFMRPFPFATDARGQQVDLMAVFSNMLIGAQPDMGKTTLVRLIAAAAALDPYVQLLVFDGKGGSDLMALERVAHRFGLGERDAVVELLLHTLRELVDEMGVRYERMRDLRRKGMVRESKITPAIARNPALKMPITVLLIDEVHEYFEHPKHGAEIKALTTNVSRRGRALGIVVALATQRPDGGTIPTPLRSNCHIRACGRVDNRDAEVMVVGDIPDDAPRATRIQRHQQGTVVLRGVSDDVEGAKFDCRLVRGHYVDDDGFEQIIDRAHALRVKANTVTGAAAGEELAEDTPPRLLDDVVTVFRPGEDQAWLENLARRLAEAWPQLYSGWTARTLGGNLRDFQPHGVPSKDIWSTPDAGGKATTRRGVVLADVLAAHRALAGPPDDEEDAS